MIRTIFFFVQNNCEPSGLHVICFKAKMLLLNLEMSPNRHIIHISFTKKSKTKNNYPIINVYCEMMMYVSNIDIFLRILELTWWRICWILKCRTCWIYSSSSRYGFMLFCSVPSLFSLNAINLLKKLMIMIIKNYLKVYHHHHQINFDPGLTL